MMDSSEEMQNSGINEEVSVSYIKKDGTERMITAENFTTALSFARAQALRGDKVTLILNKPKSKHSRKHDQRKEHRHEKHRKSSRSHSDKPRIPRMSDLFENMTRAEESDDEDNATAPPEWFTTYMANFKEEISVMLRHSMLYSIDLIEIMIEAAEKRRESKTDQRRRKHAHLPTKTCEEEQSTDEFSQETIISPKLVRYIQKIEAKEKKLERKYEAKIGKLESKVKRIVKKSATGPTKPSKEVKSFEEPSTSEQVQKPERSGTRIEEVSSTRPESPSFKEPEGPKMLNMNAHQLHRQMHCEYVKRGQIVTKSWEVMNTGLVPWSDETSLCFTWGSSSLVPLAKSLKVPKLKPGEVGVVSVLLQAPDAVGRFESYWHFYHNNVRFGQWLGCVYVINEEGSENFELPQIKAKPLGTTDDMKLVVAKPESYEPEIQMNIIGEDSDSDNISVISGTISVTSCTDQADEYVMIPMPQTRSSSESESSEDPELINLEDEQVTPTPETPETVLKPIETVLKPEKHFTELEKKFELTQDRTPLIEFPESSSQDPRKFVFTKSGTGFETFEEPERLSTRPESSSQEPELDVTERLSSRYAYVYGKGNKPSESTRSVTPEVHILPETIVNGAIQVASNAFNTAVNVYEMIRGSTEDIMADLSPTTSAGSTTSQREKSEYDCPLKILSEMGFHDRDLNLKLLKRYDNNVYEVIARLV